jgi:hypothetical protein
VVRQIFWPKANNTNGLNSVTTTTTYSTIRVHTSPEPCLATFHLDFVCQVQSCPILIENAVSAAEHTSLDLTSAR